MGDNGEYYKILTNHKEMLNRLKPCGHHGFGGDENSLCWLKNKKVVRSCAME